MYSNNKYTVKSVKSTNLYILPPLSFPQTFTEKIISSSLQEVHTVLYKLQSNKFS